MPGLLNWMQLAVGRKGTASVRLTHEEVWLSGWSGHGEGAVG